MSLEKLTGLPVNSVSYIMNFLCTAGFLDKLDIGNANIQDEDRVIRSINFIERKIHICEENGGLVYKIEGIPPEEFKKIRDRLIDYCMERAKS